jgi:hypothetical protein
MSIEFRCGGCRRLLRTGDDTAGRQAQCPECGRIGRVPGPGESREMLPPPSPLPQVQAPFEAGTPPPDVAGSESPREPSPAPAWGTPTYQRDPWAAQRVSGPATALMVLAIVQIVIWIPSLAFQANHLRLIMPGQHGQQQIIETVAGNRAWAGVSLALSVVILFGAIQMKRLQHYALARTAAIIAVIPCLTPCCILGLPFGIWALMVLGDNSVRAAFRS